MTPRLVDTPVIETARLTLRAPAPGDWERWVAFATSDRASFIGGPFTRPLAWRAFCHIVGMWVVRGFGSFVFTLRGSDEAVGMSGPWLPEGQPEREIGWSVWSPEHEGRGYAAEAAAVARRHAYEALGWDGAVSYIDPANARSIRLAERLGARLDPAAATPEGHPCLVYRHPAPEARA